MVNSNTRTRRAVAAFAALALSTSALLPSVSAKCSHDIAQRGLEQHNRILAMRESMPLEKRQSPPPIDLSQQRGILGMLHLLPSRIAVTVRFPTEGCGLYLYHSDASVSFRLFTSTFSSEHAINTGIVTTS